MMGVGNIPGDAVRTPQLTEAERAERDLFRKLEALSSVSSQLLNIVASISYGLLTRTWTLSRRADYAETLRSLADRLEKIEPTE